MADLSEINGRVLGGDQGEGVLIESVGFVFDANKDGEDIVVAELVGTAKTMLRDNYSKSHGFVELPVEVPVSERIKFLMAGDKKADNQISFDRLNRQLDIQPPLKDTEDVYLRFTEEHPESVVNQIVGKRLYFSAKAAVGKTGEKASDYYFNVVNVKQHVAPTMDVVKAKWEAIQAKKKAKAEAAPAWTPDE